MVGNQFRLADYYLLSIALGLRSLPTRHWRAGLRRILNPMSFPRPAEFRQALHELAPGLGRGRVLDVGSPKAALLALARRCPDLELYSIDILQDFIAPTAHFLGLMGLSSRVGIDIHLDQEDARNLPYPNEWFDWVYSISVIEHIADGEHAGVRGDSRAMQEIARVLKPAGVVTLTVPFDASGFRTEYLYGTVYEREAGRRERQFYQRYYDAAALFERIIIPSGLSCDALVLLGEPGCAVESLWNRVPMKAKLPLLPIQGVVGNALFKEVDFDDQLRARGVALRLAKPDPS